MAVVAGLQVESAGTIAAGANEIQTTLAAGPENGL